MDTFPKKMKYNQLTSTILTLTSSQTPEKQSLKRNPRTCKPQNHCNTKKIMTFRGPFSFTSFGLHPHQNPKNPALFNTSTRRRKISSVSRPDLISVGGFTPCPWGRTVYLPGTQMSLVLIGKDLLLEAKQRTNGFQVPTWMLDCYGTFSWFSFHFCMVNVGNFMPVPWMVYG